MGHDLGATAQALVAQGNGILAADESVPTITNRFKTIELESTEESRRAYREMLFTTPGLGEFISGVILFDETIRQGTGGKIPFPEVLRRQGIIPGIKVDRGAKLLAHFPDEKITEGLDGLRERGAEYVKLGARFSDPHELTATVTAVFSLALPGREVDTSENPVIETIGKLIAHDGAGEVGLEMGAFPKFGDREVAMVICRYSKHDTSS